MAFLDNKNYGLPNKILLHLPSQIQGIVAEWLGRALQKLVQRFESARCLKKKLPEKGSFFCS